MLFRYIQLAPTVGKRPLASGSSAQPKFLASTADVHHEQRTSLIGLEPEQERTSWDAHCGRKAPNCLFLSGIDCAPLPWTTLRAGQQQVTACCYGHRCVVSNRIAVAEPFEPQEWELQADDEAGQE